MTINKLVVTKQYFTLSTIFNHESNEDPNYPVCKSSGYYQNYGIPMFAHKSLDPLISIVCDGGGGKVIYEEMSIKNNMRFIKPNLLDQAELLSFIIQIFFNLNRVVANCITIPQSFIIYQLQAVFRYE